jgi:hypothetical protein
VDFLGTLNKLRRRVQQTIQPVVEPVYQKANEKGSKVFGALNQLYNRADEAVGGNLPGGVRPIASQPPSRPSPPPPSKGFLRQYIEEIPEKGAIPIFSLTPTDEAAKTFAKSLAGPFGRQMRVIRSPGTSQQLQEQIDAATVRDGKLIHGLGEPGYERTRFPSNIEGAGIVGQFVGEPTLDNRVQVEEPYDTKPSAWHRERFKENLREGDLINAAESAGNVVFAGLGESGWTNKYPRGRVQDIGEIKPGHPFYRGGGTSR